jgi:hypothetical protein
MIKPLQELRSDPADTSPEDEDLQIDDYSVMINLLTKYFQFHEANHYLEFFFLVLGIIYFILSIFHLSLQLLYR